MHSTCFHLREKGISFESFDHVNPVAAVDAVSLFKLSLRMRSLAPLFFFSLLVSRVVVKSSPSPVPVFSYGQTLVLARSLAYCSLLTQRASDQIESNSLKMLATKKKREKEREITRKGNNRTLLGISLFTILLTSTTLFHLPPERY